MFTLWFRPGIISKTIFEKKKIKMAYCGIYWHIKIYFERKITFKIIILFSLNALSKNSYFKNSSPLRINERILPFPLTSCIVCNTGKR